LKPHISEDIFEQVKKEIETYSIIDLEKKEILIKDARSFINENKNTKELIPYAIPVSAFPLFLNTDVTIEEGYIVKRDGTKVIGNVMDEYAEKRNVQVTRKLKIASDLIQEEIDTYRLLAKNIGESKDPEYAVRMIIGRFSKSDALVKLHLLNVGSSENALSRLASPDFIQDKE
jgi:hypothetical protein